MEIPKTEKDLLCPSARPVPGDGFLFGIVSGTVERPKVAYLRQVQPVTEELIAKVQPVTPAEVFRTASGCDTKRCQHYDGSNCRLAMRVAEQLPAVTEQLPPCAIRRDCRWWHQEGSAACFRCPQVITDHYNPSDLVREVSSPTSLEESSIFSD